MFFRHKNLYNEMKLKEIDLNDLSREPKSDDYKKIPINKQKNQIDFSLDDISVSHSKIIRIENSGYDMQPSLDNSTNDSYISNQSKILKKKF